MRKKLVDSLTPFTDWVRNGAKEEEWQEFLADNEEKISQEARKTSNRLLKETGIDWEGTFCETCLLGLHAFMKC